MHAPGDDMRFDRLFEVSLTSTALLRADGTVLRVNPAFAASLGRTPDDFVGVPIIDWLDQTAHSGAKAMLASVLQSDEIGTFRQRVGTAEGDRWLRGTLVRFPVEIDGAPAVLLQAEDITNEVVADQRIRSGEATSRASLHALEQGVVLSDLEGTVRMINASGKRILGFGATELTGRVLAGDWTTYDEDGAVLPPHRRPILHTMTTGEAVHESIIGWDRSDGQRVVLRVSTQPVLDDDGTHRAVVTAFTDVTEQRAAEAERRSIEARFAALIERSSDIICLLDEQGGIVYASPAGQRVLGFRAETSSVQSFAEIVHPDDLGLVNEAFQELLAHPGDTQAIGVRLRTADGGWRQTEIVAVNRLDDPDVRGVVANVRDVTDRVEAAERLRWQAFHDPLTGLPNRALLVDRLGHALERARRDQVRTALLYIDLDRFKAVNDTHGHEFGDQLLIEVAARLAATVRGDDTVARIGGDEFVVLAESLRSEDEATSLAGRLNTILAEPMTINGTVVTVGASIGIAFDADRRADTLLRDADNALYRAKELGKNRYEVYDDSLRAAALRRISSEAMLRRALDDPDGIVVHYQPLFDLGTGALVGVEALMRIRGADGEFGSPSEFIPIAEDSGLIVAMGAGVLERACRQLAEWRSAFGPCAPAQVAVNVAARQLASSSFVSVVQASLHRAGLVPTDLVVELTESTLIGADRSTITSIDTLREMGVSLAVDDFGTGYSSLAYLKRFPVTSVKLDQTFVHGLGTDRDDTEIVKAVISLGHSLGLTTVAEGIETELQLSTLRSLGCDQGQGFHLGRPVDPAGLHELMVSGRLWQD